jgi:ABC-type nitrate/sulfonate/bicarbonate transport system ATPase subunit
MINIESLTFHYKSTPIFENFNWKVQQGDSWAVLGPSGCGKSTLLALIAGLRFPSSGMVWIKKEPLTRPRPQTGLILQDYGLLPWATVHQNVALGLKLRSFYGSDGVHAPKNQPVGKDVTAWLERLGLTEVTNKYPGQISGGQRQRTAIARTLVLEPDLLLMDEPFSSLDAPTREALQKLTLELVTEQELTLILVTHSIEESALLGKNILLLSGTPNLKVHIISNPGAGEPGYRESTAYQALCKNLRLLLENGRGPII